MASQIYRTEPLYSAVWLQVPGGEGRLVALHLLCWINLLTNNTDTSVTRMTLISHLSGVHDAAISLTGVTMENVMPTQK